MWTMLISAVVGLISSTVPKVVGEVQASRAHEREMELQRQNIQMQVELQRNNLDAEKFRAAAEQYKQDLKEYIASMKAIHETYSKSPFPWIDGFNAVLRPFMALGIMTLFLVVSTVYCASIMDQFVAGTITGEQMMNMIYTSLVGEVFMAVVGFLFGARAAMSRKDKY